MSEDRQRVVRTEVLRTLERIAAAPPPQDLRPFSEILSDISQAAYALVSRASATGLPRDDAVATLNVVATWARQPGDDEWRTLVGVRSLCLRALETERINTEAVARAMLERVVQDHGRARRGGEP
jgi:hypothetical protein